MTTKKARTATCYRCPSVGRPAVHPLSQFYKRKDGSLVSGCKECHRELSRARSLVNGAIAHRPILATARIVNAPAVAPLAVWTCEGCKAKKTTALDAFPAGWKKLGDLVPGAPVVLCQPCGVRAVLAGRGALTKAPREAASKERPSADTVH